MHDPLIHPTRRHPLTGEPLRAVGIVAGRVIWPIMGGSEDAGAGESGDTGTDTGSTGANDQGGTGDDKSTDDSLGEGGKKALAEEREARREADRRAKAMEKELEELRNANKSAEEKALDKARSEGRDEVASKVNARLVSAEVRAIAAELKFNDPRDAVAQLQGQLADISVGDDGEVDAEAVKKLVSKLAEEKKYLVAGSTTGSAADAGIGSSGNGDTDAGVTPGLGRLQHAYATSTTSK